MILFVSVASSMQKEEEEIEIKVTEVSTNKKYGKKPGAAIQVGTVGNEYDYLAQLCGPNGEKIKYKRIKSCCAFNCSSCPMGTGLLDEWEITYKGLRKPMTIYLNGYLYDEPQAPKGLGIKSDF